MEELKGQALSAAALQVLQRLKRVLRASERADRPGRKERRRRRRLAASVLSTDAQHSHRFSVWGVGTKLGHIRGR